MKPALAVEVLAPIEPYWREDGTEDLGLFHVRRV